MNEYAELTEKELQLLKRGILPENKENLHPDHAMMWLSGAKDERRRVEETYSNAFDALFEMELNCLRSKVFEVAFASLKGSLFSGPPNESCRRRKQYVKPHYSALLEFFGVAPVVWRQVTDPASSLSWSDVVPARDPGAFESAVSGAAWPAPLTYSARNQVPGQDYSQSEFSLVSRSMQSFTFHELGALRRSYWEEHYRINDVKATPDESHSFPGTSGSIVDFGWIDGEYDVVVGRGVAPTENCRRRVWRFFFNHDYFPMPRAGVLVNMQRLKEDFARCFCWFGYEIPNPTQLRTSED